MIYISAYANIKYKSPLVKLFEKIFIFSLICSKIDEKTYISDLRFAEKKLILTAYIIS